MSRLVPPVRHRRAGPLAAAVAAIALVAGACGSSGSVESAPVPTTARPPSGTADVLAEPPGPSGTTPDATRGTTATDPDGGQAVPSAPEPPEPTPKTAAAPFPIGTVELDLVDDTRPTVSRGAPVAPSRSVPTIVAYPTGPGGPWPLVVFAHGFRLGPPGYTRLIGTLAAAGYVVAAPSFPLADEAVAGSLVDRGDLPNQPGDVSFVIDQVLVAATDPVSPLTGRVDRTRIGAVGHSDGADTVLDIGYHPARSDARVVAIVALSPDAVVPAGTRTGATTPLLLAHGDADSIVPYTESVSVFEAVPSRRYFLTLVGGGHLEPVTEATAWTPVLDATVVAFLDRHLTGAAVAEDAVTGPGSGSLVARIEVAG